MTSVFRSLAPQADPALALELLSLMSQALSQEGMANYLTRRNEAAAARLWAELLQLTLATSGGASSAAAGLPSSGGGPQLFYLADRTAAAVVQLYPQDRAGWHRGAALLRLAKVAPWGKWRALREALVALDRQKAAFCSSHGPFLYLSAIAVAPGFRDAGLGSVLLDHLCRMADQQQRPMYIEVTSDQVRRWLKRHGFGESMRHTVRPHAPPVYILVRWPMQPEAPGAAARAAANGGGGGARSGQAQGAQQAAGPVQRSTLRPAGSVRSK